MPLNGVEKLGIVEKQGLIIGGRNGPLEIDSDPKTVVYAFAFKGWDPNDTPEGNEDEHVGHSLADKMALVGNFGVDDVYTAEEVVQINSALSPDFNKQADKLYAREVAFVAQLVYDALSDEDTPGKITFFEGTQIFGKIWFLFKREPGLSIPEMVEQVVGWAKGFFHR